MTSRGEIVLQTRSLSVGYHTREAHHVVLSGLNLQLSTGELVCFMGPNGVGKSTLIRALAGLSAPLAGDVILTAERQFQRALSVVLTDRVAATSLTVYDLVAFGRYPYLDWTIRMRPGDMEIIERSIQAVHIDSLRDKKLYELSDGQLQMAMIARALAQDSDIILLDEPTAHLDLNNRLEIMNTLRRLSRDAGKAILVATHELDLVLQTADLIWLAGTDNKIYTGIPEDLVLNGTFDEVFSFKGFDLKTGKVQQEPWRRQAIRLDGAGYGYLWTKNALERSGYSVTDEAKIFVSVDGDPLTWSLHANNAVSTFSSLSDTLQALEKI